MQNNQDTNAILTELAKDDRPLLINLLKELAEKRPQECKATLSFPDATFFDLVAVDSRAIASIQVHPEPDKYPANMFFSESVVLGFVLRAIDHYGLFYYVENDTKKEAFTRLVDPKTFQRYYGVPNKCRAIAALSAYLEWITYQKVKTNEPASV